MDDRINVNKIFKAMGCDNCANSYLPNGTGPCENCGIDCEKCPFPPQCNHCMQVPRNYCPMPNTIYDKAFNNKRITYSEYEKFLND